MMKNLSKVIYKFVFSFAALITLLSCSGSDSGSVISTVGLDLGDATTVNSSVVEMSGGVITVEDADSPIDGLELTIPSGSYSDETVFSIAYIPIVNHSGSEYLDPATPLISIENGGSYSDEIVSVKIPVAIEDGYHYMAFYYDETSGSLEGIPEITHDDHSITIAVRHFSKILVNKLDIAGAYIYGSFESGFKVKQDNWSFENYGSYLSPGGICSGMSVTSLYYYNEKKLKGGYSPLYNSYVNDSPGFGYDDTKGIQVASTAQYFENNFQGQTREYWYNLGRVKNDIWTYFMFIHSMALTQEPQYVGIFPEDGNIGHAMVVYKKEGNALYVADPNEPDDETVKIEFEWEDGENTAGEFKPFESKWNSGTDKIEFTEIFYIGKTAVVDWGDLDELWQKLENDTAGEDFPSYDLKIIESDGAGGEKESLLTDGYKASSNIVKVKVDTREFTPRINVRYEDIMLLDNFDETVEVYLTEGSNKMGFYVEAELYSDVTKETDWTWTDFQYLTIEYEGAGSPDTCPATYDDSLGTQDFYGRGEIIINAQDKDGDGRNEDYGMCTYASSIDGAPGILIRELHYIDDQFHGINKTYYGDGSIESVSPYTNGEPHGLWLQYAREYLFSETPYEMGKKHGTYKVYWSATQLKSTTEYVNDERHGQAIQYSQDGSLFACHVYQNGDYVSACSN